MAQTESRTGFRLPWSSDDRDVTREMETPQDVEPERAESLETESSDGPLPPIDPAPNAKEASVQSTAIPAAVSPSASGSPKKPTKFLADLTRAMQVAAEAARASTLEQFQADAKAHVEGVHTRSAEAAAEIRKSADDDIARIREWSKAEIARVREETDRKVTNRKTDLDEDLEAHAARIERDIERVQTRVAAFEAEMARFFERLTQEDDPAEFAALAENMPEAPAFDGDDLEPPAPTAAARSKWAESPAPETETPTAAARSEWAESPAPETEVPPAAARSEWAESPAPETEVPPAAARSEWAESPAPETEVPPAAARSEWAESPAPETETPTQTETTDDAPGYDREVESDSAAAGDDLRLRGLGLSAGLDAAEAEAQAAAEASAGDDIPTIDDDDLAARLAGLVPSSDAPAAEPGSDADAALSSQVVVTGLVSVASIAGFKRQLGRITGVQSVGVSSGPEGEFLFAVAHGPEVDLAEAIPTLSGFEARVTGSGGSVVNVSARDPESES